MKTSAVIFDIDGTISDSAHRGKYAREKNWAEFFRLMPTDEPKHDIVELLLMYYNDDYKILLVTGRGEEHREATLEWLGRHGISNYVHELYMRPLKDFRPDHEIKKEIYINRLEPEYKVRAVFEDRSSVVQMWRSLGLTCLQVDEGNF